MIPAKKRGRRAIKPSEEELAMLYSSMTAGEIAKHYNVKETTVRKWLYDYRKRGRTL